jgi:S1-C subfamily serine protease
MAGAAVAAAAAIGGGGFALGAVTAEPGRAASPPAAAAQQAGTAQRAGTAGAGYADVVGQVLPSVVLIRTASGLGSGVVLDDKGNIVTNAHVAGTATKFEVQLSGDPQPREARLVGSYPASDLAVIGVDDRAGLVPASFGDSAKARVGDVVLAVGNPLGLSGSVTEGIISAAGRVVTEPASASSPGTVLPDAIQTSAPINPGNSGGALVNTAGQVIGIPTAAASGPQGSQAQGIGFAIPANLVRDIAGQLITSGHIQAVGQTRTPDAAALTGALAARDPGQAVPVTVDRGGQTVTVQVTLGELPGS